MTRDEHKAIIDKLMAHSTTENQAEVSELLTQLSDDYEETLTSLETSNSTVTQLTENNEKLRDVNAKLFLKVGEIPKPENNSNNDNNVNEEDAPSFESLFNEKGELL